MGKDLHYSIKTFLLSRLKEHQTVARIDDISTDEYYIYRVIRNNGFCDVVILVSDAYYFGEFDYLSKPTELNNGGFVLIAKPEAHFPEDSQENYIEDKIIIGKIGVLLGALRVNDFWTYQKPTEDTKKKRHQIS